MLKQTTIDLICRMLAEREAVADPLRRKTFSQIAAECKVGKSTVGLIASGKRTRIGMTDHDLKRAIASRSSERFSKLTGLKAKLVALDFKRRIREGLSPPPTHEPGKPRRPTDPTPEQIMERALIERLNHLPPPEENSTVLQPDDDLGPGSADLDAITGQYFRGGQYGPSANGKGKNSKKRRKR